MQALRFPCVVNEFIEWGGFSMDFTGLILQYLPLAVGGVLLLLAMLFFLWQFIIPSQRLKKELDTAIQKLDEIKQRLDGAPIVVLAEIQAVMVTDELQHLWSEYAETLHPQKDQKQLDEFGQPKIIRYRATAMAEVFFAEQALVETPLRTAFYKHLPGILTGLGIIGTFSGLINGLQIFDATNPNPDVIKKSLDDLIHAVGHAFIVSAVAISLAMLCTWWTNRELTKRYRQVERLCQLIDSFFDAGAGEEYLARLVEASETSATQATQLKDALVTDLKQILTELTERQIREMSSGIGIAIADNLRGPLEDIAGRGQKRDDAVDRMLADVLSNFSTRMEKMFGGQLSGMSELLTQTTQAMQATATRFDQLASNLDTAGQNGAEAMANRLEQAITSMEARQGVLNKQMGEFVEQIRTTVSQSQTESAQKLQETLGKLGEQVAGVIGQIQEQSREHTTTQTNAVTNLSSQVEVLIAQLVKTSSDLQSSVSALSSATTSSIDRMNSGAEMLAIAADDFAKAGQGVAGTMNASADATGKIQTSAQSLSTATASIQQMFADYRRTSDALAAMLADLKATVETAKKEAGMTTQLVGQLKAAADQLGRAQQQADSYLQGINKVLTETHQTFSAQLTKTLGTANTDFQKEMGVAVGMLSGSIKDLSDTLDDLPTGKKG